MNRELYPACKADSGNPNYLGRILSLNVRGGRFRLHGNEFRDNQYVTKMSTDKAWGALHTNDLARVSLFHAIPECRSTSNELEPRKTQPLGSPMTLHLVDPLPRMHNNNAPQIAHTSRSTGRSSSPSHTNSHAYTLRYTLRRKRSDRSDPSSFHLPYPYSALIQVTSALAVQCVAITTQPCSPSFLGPISTLYPRDGSRLRTNSTSWDYHYISERELGCLHTPDWRKLVVSTVHGARHKNTGTF
ncbi:hypothetical protein VTN02DRAFT_1340 [Thermoascus thermophilus]